MKVQELILERKIKLNIEQILMDTKNIIPKNLSSEDIGKQYQEMLIMQQLYNAAIREISTKLEILDEEFQVINSHSPIHHLESRLKSPSSIVSKLVKKGQPLDFKSTMKTLTDIAGIRVICHYIDEIYTIESLLSKQDDVTIIKKTDYIKNPKPNGYRSLHLIVSIPVFLSEKVEHVPVEIQMRTIAMDFWASLEHNIRYKSNEKVSGKLHERLKNCAESIASIDVEMQEIYKELNNK